MARDYIRDNNQDLQIVDGDFVSGSCELQEVEAVLLINQGELKSDPVVGCNMIRMIKANADQVEIQHVVREQLERDDKDYNQIKEMINLK